jgi:O-acetyl-ADP-ribose deacetylase (regulator of RNase III)
LGQVTGVDLMGPVDAGAKLSDTVRIDVIGHDRDAAARERDGDGQADITETYDRDVPLVSHPCPPWGSFVMREVVNAAAALSFDLCKCVSITNKVVRVRYHMN